VSLPDGFVVALSPRLRVDDGGRTLIGGTPTRVLYLTEKAAGLIRAGRIEVVNAASRALAERLLNSGMADPVAAELPAVDPAELTVVVPVRDRPDRLGRLLAGLGGVHRVIVVDDASRDPEAVAAVVGAHGASLLVLDENRGPAGARNAGLRLVETPYLAFVDSDVLVAPGTLQTLLRHFADPSLAMVAPRILAIPLRRAGWIARYEEARSSLDLGPVAAAVGPGSPVGWLPGTVMVARTAALGDGFDPDMRVGEDVDLVWRLTGEGWRVRYDPAARAWHDHRIGARAWFGRKLFYGTSAAPLAERHPGTLVPAIFAPWSLALVASVMAQRRWSIPVAAGIAALEAVRIAGRLGRSERPGLTAATLVARGAGTALGQTGALLLRHWWPLALAGSLVSHRVRRAVAVAAIADTAVEYLRTPVRLDPVRFFVARRLDDLAYGAGVWLGSIRARSIAAMVPRVGSGE